MKKYSRYLVLASVVLMISSTLVIPVAANSTERHWDGVDSSGAFVRDSHSPIIVEKELLTFDLQQLPEPYVREVDSFLSYSGKVSAEYTFYNPSDYSVTASLLFPFGYVPTYAPDDCYGKDVGKYQITVNGMAEESTLRHTLSDRYSQFDLDTDLTLLHDDYVADEFYAPDLPVTKYVFMPSGVDTETYEAADAGFDMVRDDLLRKVYYKNQTGLHTQQDGTLRVHSWVENDEPITIYVIGQDYEAFPLWKFYQNGGVKDDEEIDGVMTIETHEEMTFFDLAMSEWDADSGISEIDWYNAVVSMLTNESDATGSNLHLSNYGSLDLRRSLMRWYEYDITLEPGERIVNTVTAPIYPSINEHYEPKLYSYTYLLSPAQTWQGSVLWISL